MSKTARAAVWTPKSVDGNTQSLPDKRDARSCDRWQWSVCPFFDRERYRVLFRTNRRLVFGPPSVYVSLNPGVTLQQQEIALSAVIVNLLPKDGEQFALRLRQPRRRQPFVDD